LKCPVLSLGIQQTRSKMDLKEAVKQKYGETAACLRMQKSL
jgi:hypothetical protein